MRLRVEKGVGEGEEGWGEWMRGWEGKGREGKGKEAKANDWGRRCNNVLWISAKDKQANGDSEMAG